MRRSSVSQEICLRWRCADVDGERQFRPSSSRRRADTTWSVGMKVPLPPFSSVSTSTNLSQKAVRSCWISCRNRSWIKRQRHGFVSNGAEMPRRFRSSSESFRCVLRRKSCEQTRSPTIPREIRRRSSSSSAESPGRQRKLVARLMGLEDSSPSSRKFHGALEKCDEDLQTLRRIIEAVRLAEVKTKAVVSAVESAQRPESGGRKETKTVEFGGGERPSPVSVFDAISSPRYRSKRHHNEKAGGSEISAVGSKIVKPSRMSVLFSGENCKKSRDGDGDLINERLGTVCRNPPDDDGMPPLPPPPPQRAYELKELIARRLTEGCRQRRWWWQTKRSLSQAMVENVGEVWEDGVWEERWEVGRVAVALAGDVLWDLVEEAVTDLMACCCELSFARRRACRKRLYF